MNEVDPEIYLQIQLFEVRTSLKCISHSFVVFRQNIFIAFYRGDSYLKHKFQFFSPKNKPINKLDMNRISKNESKWMPIGSSILP